MKRMISLMLASVLIIACLSSPALAESADAAVQNWWSAIGPSENTGPDVNQEAQESDPLQNFLSSLMRNSTTRSDAPTPEPAPEPTPEPEPLFDEGVRGIPASTTGNGVDIARFPGWSLTRGYYIDRYCIIGMADSGERMALTTSDPMNFIPAGDAFIYYGEHAKGQYGWLIQEVGNNAPLVLPLGVSDSVFYADQDRIWYYTSGNGTSITIRTMNHEGKQKKKLGTTNGMVVAMMADEKILTVNFDKNRLSLWKDGKSETIYEPEEPIESVLCAGKDIWVQHAAAYGLVEGGELRYKLPGRIITNAGNEHVIAFLAEPYADAAYYDVMLFNADYRACAHVGTIQAQSDANIEIRPNDMTVWGPVESRDYAIPEASAWLPYGSAGLLSQPQSLGNEGWRRLLVGSWHAAPSVGSGYAERLVFTDGWLWRIPDQYTDGGSVRRYEWTVEDDELALYQQARLMDRASLQGPFDVPENESPYDLKAQIGGVTYYKMSDDPAYFADLADYAIDVG